MMSNHSESFKEVKDKLREEETAMHLTIAEADLKPTARSRRLNSALGKLIGKDYKTMRLVLGCILTAIFLALAISGELSRFCVLDSFLLAVLFFLFGTALTVKSRNVSGTMYVLVGICTFALGHLFEQQFHQFVAPHMRAYPIGPPLEWYQGQPLASCVRAQIVGGLATLIGLREFFVALANQKRLFAPSKFDSANAEVIHCGAPVDGLFMNWIVLPVALYFLGSGIWIGFHHFAGTTLFQPLTSMVILVSFLISLLVIVRTMVRSFRLQRKITCSAEGMLFDEDFKKSLQRICFRAWSDLHSVEFSGVLNNKELTDLQKLVGCYLTMSFKPTDSVTLDLSRMKRTEVVKLLLQLEAHSSHSVLTKEAFKFNQIMLGASSVELDVDEQLNTDNLEMQFSATHFVPLSTGTILQNGAYKIVTQIASGGMSSVYSAQQGVEGSARARNAGVVIKECVLPVNTDEKSKLKARELFAREAKTLAKLDHPQIVKVLDSFVENEREYIVLEYKAGTTLRQIRQRNHQDLIASIPDWAYQIVQILDYLHSLEPPVIHRDLTPDNLILTDCNKIFAIDFGVSNEFIGNATGTLVGKQAYISPEQFRGKAEPKSDLYSLGATLYYLYTGKDPVALSVSDPREKIDNSLVPSSMADVIVEITQLTSLKRPSAADLKNRLKTIVEGQKLC